MLSNDYSQVDAGEQRPTRKMSVEKQLMVEKNSLKE
jgi:hypothetical protein